MLNFGLYYTVNTKDTPPNSMFPIIKINYHQYTTTEGIDEGPDIKQSHTKTKATGMQIDATVVYQNLFEIIGLLSLSNALEFHILFDFFTFFLFERNVCLAYHL